MLKVVRRKKGTRERALRIRTIITIRAATSFFFLQDHMRKSQYNITGSICYPIIDLPSVEQSGGSSRG